MPLLPLPNSTEFGNLLADRQCVAYGVVALFSLACGVFVGATSKDLLQYIQTLPSGRGWILLVISSVPAIILSSILSVCGSNSPSQFLLWLSLTGVENPFKRFSETRHLSASNFAAACGIHPYISRKVENILEQHLLGLGALFTYERRIEIRRDLLRTKRKGLNSDSFSHFEDWSMLGLGYF